MNVRNTDNMEQECYTPTNVAVTSSGLTITTLAQTTTCGKSTAAYGSGMLASKFTFTYGTVEFVAQMPGGTGPWPAIWLLGAKCQPTSASVYNAPGCNWPNAGSEEQDITEILNSNHTSVNQQLHLASGSPGCSAPSSDVSKSLITYKYVWTATSEDWFINGKHTCGETVPIPATSAAFIIVNVADGGCCGGTPVNSTYPQRLIVQSLTVTQNGVVVFDGGFSPASTIAPPTNLHATVQ